MDRGGLERQLFYLLRAMDRDRYQPAVVVWNYHDDDIHLPELAKLGIPVYSFPSADRRKTKLKRLRALLRELRPEVIHSYSFYTNIAASWAAWGTGTIPVGSVRSDFNWAKRESGPVLGRLSARWPRNQICNSESALRSAQAFPGFFAPKVAGVVRNGVDFQTFRVWPVLADAPARILGIGYLLPVKRWERLLTAIQAVRLKGLNCTVRIAGDGPLSLVLRRQTRELGIDDCVEFIGHRADIPGLLAQASFVVHTADSEGCPNAVLEAMACGRAVIATDAGDISLLVQNGKTGFVVPRHDPAALVDCIARLIVDRTLCETMGQAARAEAEREFGLDRLVQDTLGFYQRAGWQDVLSDGRSESVHTDH